VPDLAVMGEAVGTGTRNVENLVNTTVFWQFFIPQEQVYMTVKVKFGKEECHV